MLITTEHKKKSYKKGSKRCKEQLVIDGVILKQAQYKGDSLSVQWFGLSLNSMSRALTTTKNGYNIKSPTQTLCWNANTVESFDQNSGTVYDRC
ncbi:hypothetical protein WA026_012314 [Henosepilachna vigintioctopunctata]|uniref:Uncharacterized protein n=1 Tax=Henosepilachna vigintioctopunctata TaxID=420089 RepID=A0AAW1UXJ3_9CUCU